MKYLTTKMVPLKVPMIPLKSIIDILCSPTMEKSVKNRKSKSKKIKKKKYQNFSNYLNKLIRTVTKDNLSLTKQSMLIMNNFLNDKLEQIGEEAGRLVRMSKKTTMSCREIQAAVKLTIFGDLATHANIEGLKAICRFHKSHGRDTAMYF